MPGGRNLTNQAENDSRGPHILAFLMGADVPRERTHFQGTRSTGPAPTPPVPTFST